MIEAMFFGQIISISLNCTDLWLHWWQMIYRKSTQKFYQKCTFCSAWFLILVLVFKDCQWLWIKVRTVTSNYEIITVIENFDSSGLWGRVWYATCPPWWWCWWRPCVKEAAFKINIIKDESEAVVRLMRIMVSEKTDGFWNKNEPIYVFRFQMRW